jgi:hypothetical protein
MGGNSQIYLLLRLPLIARLYGGSISPEPSFDVKQLPAEPGADRLQLLPTSPVGKRGTPSLVSFRWRPRYQAADTRNGDPNPEPGDR